MRRHKMSHRKSKKSFRRGAARVHPKNNRGGTRGGNRL
jgi:hypothetical protein